MSTLMAGVLLFVLGVTGLGTAVKFIPRPVVVGFTNGIAVIIASTQLKDFFGLKIDKVPGEFLARIEAVVRHFSSHFVTRNVPNGPRFSGRKSRTSRTTSLSAGSSRPVA